MDTVWMGQTHIFPTVWGLLRYAFGIYYIKKYFNSINSIRILCKTQPPTRSRWSQPNNSYCFPPTTSPCFFSPCPCSLCYHPFQHLLAIFINKSTFSNSLWSSSSRSTFFWPSLVFLTTPIISSIMSSCFSYSFFLWSYNWPEFMFW